MKARAGSLILQPFSSWYILSRNVEKFGLRSYIVHSFSSYTPYIVRSIVEISDTHFFSRQPQTKHYLKQYTVALNWIWTRSLKWMNLSLKLFIKFNILLSQLSFTGDYRKCEMYMHRLHLVFCICYLWRKKKVVLFYNCKEQLIESINVELHELKQKLKSPIAVYIKKRMP